MVPPPSVKNLMKVFSHSRPGANSVTLETTRLMPFFVAHCAIGAVICGTVKPARTMNGERCGMTEVAPPITIIGVFDSVATGAVANASGVRPKPARNITLSRAMSSCARRFVVSGASPPSSLTSSSTLRPATVSPLRAM